MKTKTNLLSVFVLLFLFFITNVNAQDIYTACKQGDLEGVKKAIEAGTDVNAKDQAGNTPLGNAYFWPEITKYLLEKGADVNGGNYPALISACNNYSTEVVKILLDAGADPNKAGISDPSVTFKTLIANEQAKGKSANKTMIKAWEGAMANLKPTEVYALAVTVQQTNCVPCLEMMFAKGANKEFKSAEKDNLLHIYGVYGLSQDARKDLFAKGKVNMEAFGLKVPDWYGNLPADRNGTIEQMVHTLIKAGVDINLKNAKGQTPLEFAEATGKTDIAAAFKSYGAESKEDDFVSAFAKATEDIAGISAKFDFPTEGRNSDNGGGYSANLDLLTKKPQKVALVGFYVYDPSSSSTSGGAMVGQASLTAWRITDAEAQKFADGFYESSINPMIEGFKKYNVDLLTPDKFLDTDEKMNFFTEFDQESGKIEKTDAVHLGKLGTMATMSTIKACPAGKNYRPFFVVNEQATNANASNFLTAGVLGANRKMTSSLGYELANGLGVDAVAVCYIVVRKEGPAKEVYTVDAVSLFMFGPNPKAEGSDDANRGQFYCGTRYFANNKTFMKKGAGSYDNIGNVMSALADRMCKWVIKGER